MHRTAQRAAALAIFTALTVAPATAFARRSVKVYLAWWVGKDDGLRKQLDSWMDCLLLDMSYPKIFDAWGGADITYGGSIDVPLPPPSGHFGLCDNDWAFVNTLIDHGRTYGDWPVTAPGETVVPFYVFMVPKYGMGVANTNYCKSSGCDTPGCPGVCLDGYTCGLNNGWGGWYGSDQSQHWLISWVDAVNCCWVPGSKTDLEVASAATLHEVAEEISAYLGWYYGNSGSGVIGDSCGIYGWSGKCPNAPTADYEVQDLNQYGTCDFKMAVTSSTCAPVSYGCGGDVDCCSGESCQIDKWGGGLCCGKAGHSCSTSADCCSGLSCNGGSCSDYSGTVVSTSYPSDMWSGQTATASVDVKNTGVAWDTMNSRIGTQDPQDRDSAFADSTWIGPSRPTAVAAATPTGSIGHFQFELRAPDVAATTTYVETFGLVQEGVTWMALDKPIVLTINVHPGSPPRGAYPTTPAGQLDGRNLGGGCTAAPRAPSGAALALACLGLAAALLVARRRRR